MSSINNAEVEDHYRNLTAVGYIGKYDFVELKTQQNPINLACVYTETKDAPNELIHHYECPVAL